MNIQVPLQLDISEQENPSDREDIQEQEEQPADIRQRRQRVGEGVDDHPDLLGLLDKFQDS